MLQWINHFCALHWTCFNGSMAFLQWVAQNWTQCFRCDLPSAEERGDTTSNDPLLFLTQPRILLDIFISWFIFNWHSHGSYLSCLVTSPGPLLQSCFAAIWLPACTVAWGYFFTFHLLNLMQFPFLHPVKIPPNGNTAIW